MLDFNWWRSNAKEHQELSVKLRKMLRKLSVREHTLIDFAAEGYVKEIILEKVTRQDIELLFSDLRKLSAGAASATKYWFFSFLLIGASALDLSRTFRLQLLEVEDNDLFLAISVLAFSLLNTVSFILEREAEMQKRVIRIILKHRTDLDPSRAQRYMLASRGLLTPWSEELRRERILPGWRYFAIMLALLPILIAFGAIIVLIFYIPVWAAYSLYVASDKAWLEFILLAAVVSTTAVRLFGHLITDKFPIGYREFEAERNFHLNVEKYGLEGALHILHDEIDEIRSEFRAEARETKKSMPVARVRTGRPGRWTP